MKRINILIVMLLVFAGLITIQSCKIDEPTPIEFGAFTAPVPSSPLDGELVSAVVSATDTTVVLTWATTDADGDSPNCDVYFGEDEDPPLYMEDHKSLSLSLPVDQGKTYYWKVVMWDANNIQTISDVYHFTIAIDYDVDNYLGLFDCDEPGYGSYPVTLTKIDESTIENDNFWDSGWAVQYVFDNYGKVTIVPVTISGYHIESVDGGFNNADQSWWTEYIVTNATTGVTIDHNVHTFTRP
jgi:hypothetical protein